MKSKTTPSHHESSKRGEGDGSHHSEAAHKPARLVELSNLKTMAEVPGQVPEAVEEVVGDGEGDLASGVSERDGTCEVYRERWVRGGLSLSLLGEALK